MRGFSKNLATYSFCVGSGLLQKLGSLTMAVLHPQWHSHFKRSVFPWGVTLQLEIGDKVIYPNHGLGVVERIETKTILGTTCGFYSLRMAASDTTVLVPVDNIEWVGVRHAIGDHEVKKLFTLLGNGKIDSHQNWKGRFKDNSDKMRTGSIRDVIDVLKSLNFLSCIILREPWYSEEEMQFVGYRAAEAAKQVGASGAIVTNEVRGLQFVSSARTIEAIEDVGIKTVWVSEEEDNENGNVPPFLYHPAVMEGVVSTGTGAAGPFPPVERVLGSSKGAPQDWYGEQDAVPGRYGVEHVLDHYGFGKQHCVDY